MTLYISKIDLENWIFKHCIGCGVRFGIEKAIWNERVENNEAVFCINGHQMGGEKKRQVDLDWLLNVAKQARIQSEAKREEKK